MGAELPQVRPAPGWGLEVDGFDAERERVVEALLATCDGRVGATGAPLAAHPSTRPLLLVGGVYDGLGPDTELLPGPVALQLPYELPPEPQVHRVLDLRSGLLAEREQTTAGELSAVRFAALARPGTLVVRAALPDGPVREGTAGEGAAGERDAPLLAPPGRDLVASAAVDGTVSVQLAASEGGVAAAVRTERDGATVDRFACYEGDPEQLPGTERVRAAVEEAASAGFDALLAEQRDAWARRWDAADVAVEGDDDLLLATRLSLFHLMGSVADSGEAAVGPRGLTGSSYRGHVFWDADTFVLPFLAATHPASARAMLEYRVRRLPAARAAARDLGRDGARFPWESARSGRDVTPTSAYDRQGRLVPILTGQLEEHIVAEVAWAACCYVDWSGDRAFAERTGLRLLVETARYWACRLEVDADGSAHLRGVIGPDEYHEDVDDDAFTNGMARWNLRRAADAVEDPAGGRAGVGPAEVQRWRALADAVVDGYDPATGRHEEFTGFSALEPLLISEVAPRRPVAADILLGRERTTGAQVVKQPAVLMLHHLLPETMPPGSLARDLDHYEPRTAHGSSLSPGIHAALLAREGRWDAALAALRIAARLDLDDLTGTTAGGVHVATGGSLWQALVMGFAGTRPRGDRLHVDPCVPPQWEALDVRLRYRGTAVRLRCSAERAELRAERPVAVHAAGQDLTVGPGGLHLQRSAAQWEVA